MSKKSFATAKTDYTEIQARLYEDGLHVQGSGEEVNRQYGVAVTFPVEGDLAAWFKTLNREINSLAGTGAKYFPAQYALRGNNVHFQVAGPTFNRSYGAAFNISQDQLPELVEFVE